MSTHLDFVDIADCMIELNRSAYALLLCLLSRRLARAICDSLQLRHGVSRLHMRLTLVGVGFRRPSSSLVVDRHLAIRPSRSTHRCCHSDRIRVAGIERAFNSISRRKEGVEPLNQIRVAAEESRNSVDNAGRVNTL